MNDNMEEIFEIFFRAWHKKEKRMYHVISINTDTNEVVVDTIVISKEYKEKIPTLTYKYPDDVLVLQYIGTKDRNNKKIFNKDIIRWRVFEEEYSLQAFVKNDYITGIVEWNGCGYMAHQITEGMNIFKIEGFVSENYTRFYDEEGQQRFDWNSVEVIGNIYEDPGLGMKLYLGDMKKVR